MLLNEIELYENGLRSQEIYKLNRQFKNKLDIHKATAHKIFCLKSNVIYTFL